MNMSSPLSIFPFTPLPPLLPPLFSSLPSLPLSPSAHKRSAICIYVKSQNDCAMHVISLYVLLFRCPAVQRLHRGHRQRPRTPPRGQPRALPANPKRPSVPLPRPTCVGHAWARVGCHKLTLGIPQVPTVPRRSSRNDSTAVTDNAQKTPMRPALCAPRLPRETLGSLATPHMCGPRMGSHGMP